MKCDIARLIHNHITVCLRSSDPFCVGSYYIKLVTTSLTYNTIFDVGSRTVGVGFGSAFSFGVYFYGIRIRNTSFWLHNTYSLFYIKNLRSNFTNYTFNFDFFIYSFNNIYSTVLKISIKINSISAHRECPVSLVQSYKENRTRLLGQSVVTA